MTRSSGVRWGVPVALGLALALTTACGDGDGGTDQGVDAVVDAPDTGRDTPLPDPGDDPGLDDPGTPADATDPDAGEDAAPDAIDTLDPGPESVTLEAGDSRLVIDRVAMTITLAQGASHRTELDAEGLLLGRVEALDDGTNYDPYPMVIGDDMYDPPPGLTWLAVTGMAIGDHDAQQARVLLRFGDKRAELTLRAEAAGRFSALLVPAADGDDIAYFRVRPRVGLDEAFYGLGAYLDQVEHRGTIRAMQLELDTELESGYNEAHVPVPFVIGTSGWGLFVECPYPGMFDVAATDATRVDAWFGTGAASVQGLAFHLFATDHPIDVTRKYYDVTGDPLLPARWALGPWIWRDEIDGQVAVEDDLRKIRDHDLATTGYWIDRPYANGVNSFDFHRDNYPDPQAMIDRMHAMGFRTALWHSPYITVGKESSPETEALLAHAKENGFYPDPVGVRFNGWGDFIDLTNPEAYAWWQSLIRRYTDMGVEGFKLDYAEDIVPGLLGVRNPWGFWDGSDERTMHSRMKLFYHRVYAETLPEDGGFLLCRAGTYGDQVNVSVIWPGDLNATMWGHREVVVTPEGKTVTAVGGLGPSMVYGLSLGPSGFPFYGSDTGGYRQSPPGPDKQTFMRWYQQTSLSTVMQVGTSGNSVPWEFRPEKENFDQEVLDGYRLYARLHLRLFPYQWTYARNLAVDGRPIQRPLGLAYPELGRHPSDTYLFGDHLLVAPVIVRDAVTRDVFLPPGAWQDWWDGTPYVGDQNHVVDAPLERLPLFLAQSGIVPLLRPTIDTLSPVAEPDAIDSYATTPGMLWVRVFPGEASTFTLFDGARIGQSRVGVETRLTWDDGDEFNQGAVFQMHGVRFPPVSVTNQDGALDPVDDPEALDAAPSGWLWLLERNGTLYVKVPGGSHAILVTEAP